MSTVSPTPSPSFVSWGVGIAASSLLLIGGGAVIWSNPASTSTPPTEEVYTGEPLLVTQHVQVPQFADAPAGGLHSVSYAHENGARVVKIRVSPDGDELVVDARTGRLIEARPPRPASPRRGQVTAPMVPVT